jgi:hypothetical protein
MVVGASSFCVPRGVLSGAMANFIVACALSDDNPLGIV